MTDPWTTWPEPWAVDGFQVDDAICDILAHSGRRSDYLVSQLEDLIEDLRARKYDA